MCYFVRVRVRGYTRVGKCAFTPPPPRSGMLLPLLTVAVVFYMLGALFGVREKKDRRACREQCGDLTRPSDERRDL